MSEISQVIMRAHLLIQILALTGFVLLLMASVSLDLPFSLIHAVILGVVVIIAVEAPARRATRKRLYG